jgi:hypothetical protein
MLRRDLWKQRPFNEKYGSGGEDSDWVRWAFGEGYVIINDAHFAVYHSHGLGPLGWIRQFGEWKSVAGNPFDRRAIDYRRKDL